MHPILYLVAEFVITTLALGFTSHNSLLRPAGFFAVVYCVWHCVPLCLPYMVRTPWAALVGGYTVTYAYHYLDVVFLSRWSYEAGGPVGSLVRTHSGKENFEHAGRERSGNWNALLKEDVMDPLLRRLLFGIKATSHFRFIGTPYQVVNVPSPTATTRKHFLLRTSLAILASYIVIDFISSSNGSRIAGTYLTKDKIPLLTRLGDVSFEEILVRFFTVMAACIIVICIHGGMYHVFGLVTVSLKISDPVCWPPLYGSLSEAYTLRRFWNVFWHQTNTRKFSSIAHYAVHNLLGLPRGTETAKYLRVLAAFAASGIMHLLDDVAAGLAVADSGAMWFFLVQVLGIMIEDMVLRKYTQIATRLTKRTSGALPGHGLLGRSVGFVWVTVFLVWSVPAYIYPMMWRANSGFNDSTVPYSLFGSGGERLQACGCILMVSLVGLGGIWGE